jgi:4-amino-4-deoxy-L-arabinose transferase-like glycosyltransferase
MAGGNNRRIIWVSWGWFTVGQEKSASLSGVEYNRGMQRWIGVGLLLVLALGLRLHRLEAVPAGYTWDEASQIYSAWSLSLWNRDEFADFLPLTFRSFGDYKPPLLIYLLAMVYKVIGLQEIVIRLISVVAGVVTGLFVYGMAKEFMPQNTYYRLVPLGLIALLPWTFHFSRIGFEQQLAFTLVTMGVYGLYKSLYQPKWLILAAAGFGLSGYAFHTAKIFVPALLLSFLLIYRTRVKKHMRPYLLFLVVMALSWLPHLYLSVTTPALARASTLLVFDGEGKWIAPFMIGSRLIANGFAYLRPDFWFSGADVVAIRNGLPGRGVLFWSLGPALVAGLWQMIKKKRLQDGFLGAWLIAGLLPGLLTWPGPHALRVLMAAAPVSLIIGLGIKALLDRWDGKVRQMLFGLILLGFMVEALSFYRAYFYDYPSQSAYGFQYGYEEVVATLNDYQETADKLVITDRYGQPYIYVLLYQRIHPQQFLFGALNQFEFRQIKWPEDTSDYVYAGSPDEIPPTDSRVIKIINVPGSDEILWVIAKT